MSDESANDEFALQSFVIFDLESTGLRWDRPKITEFAMLALTASQFQDLMKEPNRNVQADTFPNLTFLVDPKKPINQIASQITGLTNEMLEKYDPFSKVHVSQIAKFLNTLPKPIGLVAHNGKSFDFPLLQKELKLFGKLPKSLSDNLYCVDSYHAIRSTESQWAQEIERDIHTHREKRKIQDEESKPGEVQPTENSSECAAAATMVKTRTVLRLTRGVLKRHLEVVKIEASSNSPEKKRQKIRLSDICITESWSPAKEKRMSLKFEPSLNPGEAKSDENGFPAKPYRLENIYADLFDSKPPTSHRAVDDCVSLLKVIMEYGEAFVSYSNLKATKLADVNPMI